jgi:cation diffusion facilitator CzcD-associated flavoprotein CzcO
MTIALRHDQPSVVIIGTGFGGIAVAAELKRAGFHNFVLLEKATRVGGVWRENTYPGAGCDVPSPYYSFSHAPNPDWPARFSLQPEIHAYLERVTSSYGIGAHIRFGTEVTGAVFDQARGLWQVRTAAGETLAATVLVPALGQLSRPAWPDLPGMDAFTGHAFHSARWDHGYDLTGKRVAVIGTGASAVQFVPRIQPAAGKLTLFQRSAPYIVPKPDRAYGRWHRLRIGPVAPLQALERLVFWLVGEASTFGLTGNETVADAIGWIARRHRERQVRDPRLRAKLTPDYRIGCKRVLFADNYYPALTQPNVEVCTEKITELTPAGVRTADGVEHACDVVIYGTGFAATDFLGGLDLRGLGGRPLREAWTEGARAYLGLTVPGFPNLFWMYGPNTNLGSGSIIYMLERQARYIRKALQHLSATSSSYVDVREEVDGAYEAELAQRLAGSVWATCTSWYRQGNGRIPTNWPGLVSEYDRRTRTFDPSDYRTVSVPATEQVR